MSQRQSDLHDTEQSDLHDTEHVVPCSVYALMDVCRSAMICSYFVWWVSQPRYIGSIGRQNSQSDWKVGTVSDTSPALIERQVYLLVSQPQPVGLVRISPGW